MADKLADARRSLQRAKEAATRRLTEIDVERKEIKASLKSLDAALKALGARKPIAKVKTTSPDADTQPSSDQDPFVSE